MDWVFVPPQPLLPGRVVQGTLSSLGLSGCAFFSFDFYISLLPYLVWLLYGSNLSVSIKISIHKAILIFLSKRNIVQDPRLEAFVVAPSTVKTFKTDLLIHPTG